MAKQQVQLSKEEKMEQLRQQLEALENEPPEPPVPGFIEEKFEGLESQVDSLSKKLTLIMIPSIISMIILIVITIWFSLG